MEIGPGVWLEALFDADSGSGGLCVVKGRIYECARVNQAPPFCGYCKDVSCATKVGLVGEAPISSLRWPQMNGCDRWCPTGFRPVYRKKAGAFDHMKTSNREREPA